MCFFVTKEETKRFTFMNKFRFNKFYGKIDILGHDVTFFIVNYILNIIVAPKLDAFMHILRKKVT